MVTGIVLIVVGIVVYLGASFAGANHYGRTPRGNAGYTPQPGTGDVPMGFSAVALLGGALAIGGVIVVIASL